MADGIWSGGTWAAWGRENREVPIRLCGHPTNWHFEIRCSDGSANPYLSIAAMLAAGMLGVKEGRLLEARDCEVMPASLSGEARKEMGVKTRLPLTIEQARTALKEDTKMVGVFGEEFVNAYLSINEVCLCSSSGILINTSIFLDLATRVGERYARKEPD